MENPEFSTLISKAERYCAMAEHCETEVCRKLWQWHADEEYIPQIIAHLREHNYINDSRYCQAFVHDHLLINHWPVEKIRYALLSRGLPDDIISQAIQSAANI